MKPEELRFTRREVRSSLGWGDTQLKIHLARLVEMEYLLLFRRGLTYEYGLLWDGEEGDRAHLCGLLAVAADEGGVLRSGSEAGQSAPGRGVVGGQPDGKKAASGQGQQGLTGEAVGPAPDAVIRGKQKRITAVAPDDGVVQHG